MINPQTKTQKLWHTYHKNKNPKQLGTISIAKEAEGQTFMSRAERHKELQKLAQSAEDLFLNRMIK